MSTTVLEALENAQTNFQTFGYTTGAGRNPFYQMALEQLNNGVDAINNGLSLDSVIQDNMLGEVNAKQPGE